MNLLRLAPSVTALAVTLALAACNDSDSANSTQVTKAAVPTGLGSELSVPVPAVSYPLPAVDNITGNNGKAAAGESVNKYDIAHNPVIKILSGFSQIWTLGDEAWANGGANGSGPSDFSNVTIVDPTVWRENIAYVVKVTQARTYQQALEAYLDDRRDKNFSVIDGMGPLTHDYLAGSGARSNVNHTVADLERDLNDSAYFNANEAITYEEGGDDDAAKGSSDSALGKVVDLVALLRNSSASTSPAKYYFTSPRPWRMNDDGEVVALTDQTETLGDKTFPVYESSVSVVPALKYVRSTSGLGKDGGYPSGHTNAGYLAAWAYAYALPERFAELIARGSQLGENRILAGMHSPLDVIGGRIQAQVVAAAALYNSDNAELKQAAYDNAGDYFGALAGDDTIYQLAHVADSDDAWADHDAVKALYRWRMTYGFTQDTSKAGQPPVVPEGAEVLLETRQPYLTDDQRRAVLYTTAVDSGYAVLDGANGWGRLDYVTAADGYGAFLGDVTVNMDASQGRFSAHDWWRNDIGGSGLLTKQGTGTLTLTGSNSYSGGTLLQGGTLEGTSTSAFGSGDVYVQDGTLAVDASGTLVVGGSLTLDAGTLALTLDEDDSQLSVANTLYLDGGSLSLDLSDYQPASGTRLTLVSAGQLHGEFASVTANQGYQVSLSYGDKQVTATLTK